MDREISQIYLLPKLLKKNTTKAVQTGVPTACRESFLSEDDKRIYNEHKNWAQDLRENVPIWSRSKYFNCVGQQRQQPASKDNQYDIEIPNRLLSLWGNVEIHKEITGKMQKLQGYQMINNILALCASLKYNMGQWSPLILDEIVRTSSSTYPKLIKSCNITNNELHINHLNSVYKLEGSQFQVQLHQVAVGVLYMPYGLNEFNLARALMWFFKYYQFGLLKYHERCLAFGYAVDLDQGYFMYDCQSSGSPLFGENASNSYVLRTNHLQILLYCLIVTLGVVSDNEKFLLYSVDVQMEDAPKNSQPPSANKPKTKFNFTNRLHKKPGSKVTQNGLHAGNDRENRDPKNTSLTQKPRGMSALQINQLTNDHGFWNIKTSFVDTRRRRRQESTSNPKLEPLSSKNLKDAAANQDKIFKQEE